MARVMQTFYHWYGSLRVVSLNFFSCIIAYLTLLKASNDAGRYILAANFGEFRVIFGALVQYRFLSSHALYRHVQILVAHHSDWSALNWLLRSWLAFRCGLLRSRVRAGTSPVISH